MRARWLALWLLTACCPHSQLAVPPPSAKEDVAPERATGFAARTSSARGAELVIAAHPLAVDAGLEMLRAGGSAADAAIATALALGVVEPQSSGIGGGAFVLHFERSSRKVRAYDGRETAPAAATGDMFLAPDGKPLAFDDAVVGGLSVAVPGELALLELIHQRHGKLPWARLFEPAIRLCTPGFPISPRLHQLLAADPHLPTMAAARAHFYLPDGKPKPIGTVLENPALAEVLRAVAAGGAAAFYRGPIAADVVRAVRDAERRRGGLSEADLAGYRALERAALCAPYREHEVCGMPPPSSGGVATLQILGLLARFPLSEHEPRSPDAVHLFAEASRLAFADRDRYLADPDFAPVPVAALLDRDYLGARSQLIDPARSLGKASPGDFGQSAAGAAPSGELPSTSHLVVVDRAGDAVSLTASIESAFGSKLMVRGFLLNNELTDFAFTPAVDGKPVANRIEPGKRPRSSMAPTVVLRDGEVALAVGSPGGARIIAYVTQSILDTIDWRLAPAASFSLPHVVNRNGATELEASPGGAHDWTPWLDTTAAELRRRGHEVVISEHNSGLSGFVRAGRGYEGAADPRREGVARSEWASRAPGPLE